MSRFQNLFGLSARIPQQKMKPTGEWYPVLDASELLKPHHELLDQIRQCFGVPETVWTSTHGQLIQNFARRVQLLPTCEEGPPMELGGLIRLRLETVNHALKIRRGYMLPNGASTECISEQQEIWSFAVLSAALLHDIGISLADVMLIVKHHDGGESLWSLACGDLPAETSYHPDSNRVRSDKQCQALQLLVTGQLIPTSALLWLSQYPDVFKLWLLMLSGRCAEAGILGEIITKADQYATAKPISKICSGQRREGIHFQSSPPENTVEVMGQESTVASQEKNQSLTQQSGRQALAAEQRSGTETESQSPSSMGSMDAEAERSAPAGKVISRRAQDRRTGQQFIQWLRQLIDKDKIRINTEKAHLHMVEEGLLLVSPAIFKRYLHTADHLELQELQRGFLSLGIHKTADSQKSIWTYRQQGRKRISKLHGMLIPDPLTTLGLSDLPEANIHLTVETPRAADMSDS